VMYSLLGGQGHRPVHRGSQWIHSPKSKMQSVPKQCPASKKSRDARWS
jgi:hypothetical protein